jgi:hypothetical protein
MTVAVTTRRGVLVDLDPDARVIEQREAPIFENAVVVSVHTAAPGMRRQVQTTAEMAGDADPDMLTVSKFILDSPEFDLIKRLDSRLHRYLRERCLRFPFRSGMYLVPLGMLDQVQADIEDFAWERQDAIDVFLDAYPRLKDEAAQALGSHYDPEDYPGPGELRRAFRLTTQYLSFGVPERLQRVNPVLFADERRKAAATWAEATETVRQALRAALLELIERACAKLATQEKGKPRKFTEAFEAQLRDFLDTFNVKNITDDAALAEVVGRAQRLLDGVDSDLLKRDDRVREQVREAFEQVKVEVAPLVINPKRRIRLTEDEETA